MRLRVHAFGRDRQATSALEFALIAPVYFFLVLGILEIGLITFFSSMLLEGAEKGTAYMRAQRQAGLPITDGGIRSAICDSISTAGLSCGADSLKIAPYYAGVPSGGTFGVPPIIENVSDPRGGTGGQYILAVGYYWGIMLPSSKLLLPQGSGGSQIQARAYTVLAERVWDDGVRR